MTTQSAYNKIKKKVTSSKRGTLFFPDKFALAGTSDAVRSALVRLCRDGALIRVAQGIYCYPKIDTKWGSGIIPPCEHNSYYNDRPRDDRGNLSSCVQ